MDQLPTNPTNQTSQPAMSAKQPINRMLLVIVILFFGIICAGGGFVFGMRYTQPTQMAVLPTPTPQVEENTVGYPTPTPVPGWKTYSDPKLGFGFQYPANWTVNNGTQSVTLVDPSYTDPTCKGDCSQFSVSVLREPNPNNLSIPDFLKEQQPTNTPVLLNQTDTNPVGITFRKTTSSASNVALYYTAHGSDIYLISISAGTNGMVDASSPKLTQRLAQFDTLFASFHFIN